MEWLRDVITAVVTISTSVGAAWLVANQQRKGSREATQATSQVQMRTLDQTLIDKLQTQIDRQDARITIMINRQDELEKALDREERGRAAAIRYIRRLLDWIAERLPDVSPPDIPVILREDLK